MQFTHLNLVSSVGGTEIPLPVVGVTPADKYILKAADGLGPPEINVSITDTLYQGGVYQGSQSQSREIVLRIGLNPDYTLGERPRDLRETLYTLFFHELDVPEVGLYPLRVYLMNDEDYQAEIYGYVKKMEIVPFSKEPEVQLTIACTSPYFTAIAALNQIVNTTPEVVNYIGNVPVGFYYQVIFGASSTNYSVGNDATGDEIFLTYAFNSGDELVIDTRPGHREITRTRSAVALSLIDQMSSTSVWFKLYPGNNSIVSTSPATHSVFIQYTPTYWGI